MTNGVTVIYDRFSAEEYQETSVALSAVLGKGYFAARFRVNDGSDQPSGDLTNRPVEDGLNRKQIELGHTESNEVDMVLMGKVLLQTGVDPPHVLEIQNLLDIPVTEKQKTLDEKMGRAAISVMNYLKQETEDERAEREHIRLQWQQWGFIIEKQELLEIGIKIYRREISVFLYRVYPNSTRIVGGHTGYTLTPRYKVKEVHGGR